MLRAGDKGFRQKHRAYRVISAALPKNIAAAPILRKAAYVLRIMPRCEVRGDVGPRIELPKRAPVVAPGKSARPLSTAGQTLSNALSYRVVRSTPMVLVAALFGKLPGQSVDTCSNVRAFPILAMVRPGLSLSKTFYLLQIAAAECLNGSDGERLVRTDVQQTSFPQTSF